MKKNLFLSLAMMASGVLVAAPQAKHGQRAESALYHQTQAAAADDSKLFLDPLVYSELSSLSGQTVLNAGCGTGAWAAHAAQQGGRVCGVDQQLSLVQQAQQAVAAAGVEGQVHLCQANMGKLPYEAALFDRAVSINMGAELPSTLEAVKKDQRELTGLGAHCQELARVLKPGAEAIIAAPASFDVVFADASCDAGRVQEHIQQVLAKIGKSKDAATIARHLEELIEVKRATFAVRQGKLQLVTDASQLELGEIVWRKLPEGAVQNYYHSEEEYLVAIRDAGLTCHEVKRPCFFGKVKWDMYKKALPQGETALGEAYLDNHPFTIYYVTKKA